jgi:hypothetical protein
MNEFIIKVPIAESVQPIDQLPEALQEVLRNIKLQNVGKMAGTREHNGTVLVLALAEGTQSNIQTLLTNAPSLWSVAGNELEAVQGADILEWMADEQNYDSEGNPVGAPFRPTQIKPLQKYMGHPDWTILQP